MFAQLHYGYWFYLHFKCNIWVLAQYHSWTFVCKIISGMVLYMCLSHSSINVCFSLLWQQHWVHDFIDLDPVTPDDPDGGMVFHKSLQTFNQFLLMLMNALFPSVKYCLCACIINEISCKSYSLRFYDVAHCQSSLVLIKPSWYFCPSLVRYEKEEVSIIYAITFKSNFYWD